MNYICADIIKKICNYLNFRDLLILLKVNINFNTNIIKFNHIETFDYCFYHTKINLLFISDPA